MRTIFKDPQRLMFGFYVVSAIRDTFSWYQFQWMAAHSRKYSLALVREFYASYTAIIIEATHKKAKLITQPRLIWTLVRDVSVELSEAIVWQCLFSPKYQSPIYLAEFDYRLGKVHNHALMRDLTHMAT